MMQGVNGFTKIAQPEAPQDILGQSILERGPRERAFDQAPQRCLPKTGRGRIDRRQRRRQRFPMVQYTKARMDHLPAKKASAHFTEGAHARAGLKRLGLASIEIEEAQRQLTSGILDPRNQLASRAVHDLGRAHDAFHLDRQPGRRTRDRCDACLVFVAQRQV